MPDLVLYDGVCGLCNRLNQFILKRDTAERFRFASLQGSLARETLRRYGRDTDDLDTVYVVADHGGPTERLLSKSGAVIHVLRSFGGPWRAARLLEFLPASLLDTLYACVARHRYRWFGRYETCLLPPSNYRAKFLDERDDR